MKPSWDAHVIGAAATPCRRDPDTSASQLAMTAVAEALTDAGVTTKAIDAVYVANALAGLISGQECIRGQVYLQGTPLLGLPIFNVENACASGATAVNLACQAVSAGSYETVMVLGIEKMSHPDKARTFEALKGALDVEAHPPTGGVDDGGSNRSVFMDVYARKARAHNERYGSTPAHFAMVVEKNRAHAALNPIAQFREPLTVDEVLGSRMISDPLTLPMCSPIGDAAAALVITTKERAARHRGRVEVAASAVTSGRPGSDPAVTRAARAAYDGAGVTPGEIDLAEVHDATASAEVEAYEHLGFAAEGEGHLLVASGATSLGGRLPVNTSGGLICRGHPVGATGVLQLVELVTQLRGRAGARQVDRPRLGLAQNAGGILEGDAAVAVVTILAAS
jgi:acetyl-CoA acyltransferase